MNNHLDNEKRKTKGTIVIKYIKITKIMKQILIIPIIKAAKTMNICTL